MDEPTTTEVSVTRLRPGPVPGSKRRDTVPINYRIPRELAEWLRLAGGGKALARIVAREMAKAARVKSPLG